MTVAFLDPRASYLEIKEELDQAYQTVMDSGIYILGEFVENFERDFATYCEARFCVGVASGLDALVLSLKALDIGPGDEVIVPSHTFIATWLAVSAVGAVPVAVEPDQRTFNLSAEQLGSALTPRTRAVIAVHLYGLPADIVGIQQFCKRNSIFLIEDAAQAHGATYNNKKIGSHGDAVCWSFYPGKNLGAFGDGGAITTNSKKIEHKLKLIRNYGSAVKYQNQLKGMNSRLDPLQAAMLQVKLKYLDTWNARRKDIANVYFDKLRDTELVLPTSPANCGHAWHLFVIRYPKRDRLQKALAANQIGTLIHYPIPPYRQEAYSELRIAATSYPIANQMAQEVLSLPMGPHMSKTDANIVADHVLDFLG